MLKIKNAIYYGLGGVGGGLGGISLSKFADYAADLFQNVPYPFNLEPLLWKTYSEPLSLITIALFVGIGVGAVYKLKS